MATDVAVFLPCEHWTTVSHERGDRMSTCPLCGAEFVVRAEPVNVIRYLVLAEEYDDNGKLVRQEWRTMADIQAELEARQNLEAKQHAMEDELYRVGDTFPPNPRVGDTAIPEFDCPENQPLPEQLESD